ncbi:MAG: orotidine-5'-phosphate decarboxylase [Acidobacteriota bacterium]|nr:orotidine-5'-phosphate decarboxylase [Acidobacteriota bacterium]
MTSTPTPIADSNILDARERLIVALDYPTARQALDLVDRLEGTCTWLKVGMELYYAAGNSLVETLRRRGYNVFLDLKLHDIPNTVAGAVRTVTQVGASLLTLHASGGRAMMTAAAAAATAPGSPRLLAVSVLTSMDSEELAGVGVTDTPTAQVLRLSTLAKQCGINGIVCSPQEVDEVREALGAQALLVTPGIRGAGDAVGDQRRIATAGDAIGRGASMLVVGRPITQAAVPAQAASLLLQEIARADKR